MMEERLLGQSGIAVSALGLGCNAFGMRIDEATSREVIHAALDAGVTLFDTADGYGSPFGASEEMLGRVLAGHAGKVVIATKGGANPSGWTAPPDASRKGLTAALDASLARLRVERIDYYQVHFFDPATPLEETLRAMDDMVRAGKVRAIGRSNYSAAQVAEAARLGIEHDLARFAATQAEYHLLSGDTAAPLLAELAAQGMSLLPYFPLAGGLLTGKYAGGARPDGSRFSGNPAMGDHYMTARNLALVDALSAFASERGMTLPDLAIAWLLAQPVVASVIAGATSGAQVRTNAASAAHRLSPEDMDGVTAILSRP